MEVKRYKMTPVKPLKIKNKISEKKYKEWFKGELDIAETKITEIEDVQQ